MNNTNTKNIKLIDLFNMFTQINEDCARGGDCVVPFDDIDFYADQIHNLYEAYIDHSRAYNIARELYNFASYVMTHNHVVIGNVEI